MQTNEADWGEVPAVDLSAAPWRKSRSSGPSGSCVEIAPVAGDVAVRDSKDRRGPALVFNQHAWSVFAGGVKRDGFSAH